MKLTVNQIRLLSEAGIKLSEENDIDDTQILYFRTCDKCGRRVLDKECPDCDKKAPKSKSEKLKRA